MIQELPCGLGHVVISRGSHQAFSCAWATLAELPNAGPLMVSVSCQEGVERQQPALPCCRALLVALLLPLAFPPRAHLLIFLPPSLSSYAKQLISPISSQAPFLIVHQWFLCCPPSLLLSLISAARKQRSSWDIYRKCGVFFRLYCCLISLLHSRSLPLPLPSLKSLLLIWSLSRGYTETGKD